MRLVRLIENRQRISNVSLKCIRITKHEILFWPFDKKGLLLDVRSMVDGFQGET